jgi:hypothetical protein
MEAAPGKLRSLRTLVMRRSPETFPIPARTGRDADDKASLGWLMWLVGWRAWWNADDHE